MADVRAVASPAMVAKAAALQQKVTQLTNAISSWGGTLSEEAFFDNLKSLNDCKALIDDLVDTTIVSVMRGTYSL